MQITRNDIKESKKLIIYYCAFQYVLKFFEENKIGYNAGCYGWNYDYYSIHGIALITGYRPVSGISPCREDVDKIENAARKLWDDWKPNKENYLHFIERGRRKLLPMIVELAN